MSQNVLHVENITMQFGGVVAVNDLSMDVNEGEIVALIGPNGAGKTTAFNCITGVYEPTNGQVNFYGKPMVENHPQGKMKKLYSGDHAGEYSHVISPTPDKITKLGIARTFQNIRLFGDLSVYDNLLTACQKNISYSLLDGFLRTPKCRAQEECFKLLETVGLASQRDQRANNLPYGMQRRLEIARALATRPKLLLLDEPAAGMNEEESAQLSEFILSIRRERGITIVIIDHHMDVIMSICDRMTVLNFGTLLAEGEPDEIQNNPDVITAYLGVDE